MNQEQRDFNFLDIVEILALGLQVKSDEESSLLKQQLDRIERKLDLLLSKGE